MKMSIMFDQLLQTLEKCWGGFSSHYLDEDVDVVCDLEGHHFDFVLAELKITF